MATKKENRREQVRRARHVLNRNFEAGYDMSGHRINQMRYGDGLNRTNLREYDQNQEVAWSWIVDGDFED